MRSGLGLHKVLNILRLKEGGEKVRRFEVLVGEVGLDSDSGGLFLLELCNPGLHHRPEVSD